MCEIVPRHDMATTTARETDLAFTVAEPVDDDGSCTLHEPATGTSYHVVDYADSILREKLATRTVGERVRVNLAPADPDALDWIVTRIRPGAPTTPGGQW